MNPQVRGRAANSWCNQAQHQAAEPSRAACQLRRTAAPTLALKIAAGRIKAIATEIELTQSSEFPPAGPV